MQRGRRLLPTLVGASLLLLGPEALADEDEWLLALEATPGLRLSADDPSLLLAGGLSAWAGFSDHAWLMMTAGGGKLFEGGSYGQAAFGIVWALDVFRAVPYLELPIGIEWESGEAALLVRPGLGVDYLISTDFGVGTVVRYHPVLRDETGHMLEWALRFYWRGDW